MKLTYIKYNMNDKLIEVHYNQGNTNLKADATGFRIQFHEFFKRHLQNDMQIGVYPVYVDIPTFRMILNKVLSDYPKHAVAQQVLDNLSFIEQDMHQRIVQIETLPQEFNTTFNSPHPNFLERIIKMNDIVDSRISKQSRNWQLLYVVQTTLIQTFDTQPFTVIKLGKTKDSIESYVNNLRTQYEKKIQFKPLFARRMYCPNNTHIDTKPFHNRLISLVPRSKIFLRSSPKAKNQRSYRVEFYLLTEEFITNFEQCLRDFMTQHEEEYVKYEKQQVEQSDETSALQQSILDGEDGENGSSDSEINDEDETQQIDAQDQQKGIQELESTFNNSVVDYQQQSRNQSSIMQDSDGFNAQESHQGSIINYNNRHDAVPPGKLSDEGLLKVKRILNLSGGRPVSNIIKKMLLLKQMQLDQLKYNLIPVPAQ